MVQVFPAKSCAQGHLWHALVLSRQFGGVPGTPGVKENDHGDLFPALNQMPCRFDGKRAGGAPSADVVRASGLDRAYLLCVRGNAIPDGHRLVQLTQAVEGAILAQSSRQASVQ